MKNGIRRISTLLMALALVLSLSVPAFASSVTFEGKSRGFSFDPGSGYSSTDLFGGFKGVMPGDELSETVTVTNNAREFDYVKVYLRARTHSNSSNTMVASDPEYGKDAVEMKDFLSKLTMRVYNGSKLIFEASPEELDGLSKNVYLGSLEKNENLKLTVELDVPIELGNEYANRVGEVDWVFTVEGFNYSDSPKTGDEFNMVLMIGIMAVSAVGIVAVIVLLRKRGKK